MSKPYFISSIQHIENILIIGQFSNLGTKCTTDGKKKTGSSDKNSLFFPSLISIVVRVKMEQGGGVEHF